MSGYLNVSMCLSPGKHLPAIVLDTYEDHRPILTLRNGAGIRVLLTIDDDLPPVDQIALADQLAIAAAELARHTRVFHGETS